MEMEKQIKSSSSPNLNRLLLRTLSKLFRFRKTGISAKDSVPKIKFKADEEAQEQEEDKIYRNKWAMEAMCAKLFACVSSVKAAYAQLQMSQIPYDPDGIQCADEMVVDELKILAQLKHSYLNNHIDDSPPQVTFFLAQLQEQKSLLKMYEITGKKLESEMKLRDSEITFLREKLEEIDSHNRLFETRIESLGSVSIPDSLDLCGLNVTNFLSVRKSAIESIESFVKLILHKSGVSGWDVVASANSIEPNMVNEKLENILLVLESSVCTTMFDTFQFPKFGLSKQEHNQIHYFDAFKELKSTKVKEFLEFKPRSTFGNFCRVKYLKLVHTKMELAFFGDLKQRNMVDSGGYPETAFFVAFAEMAKQVWLLHCLAFSFEQEASIFQIRKGCRFSEVFMENVVEDDQVQIVDPRVGFTVVPGFKIANTVIQCQVYLS